MDRFRFEVQYWTYEQALELPFGLRCCSANGVLDGLQEQDYRDDMTRSDTAEYRSWYDRGWRYSHRDSATLDYGDSQGFPDAWYDGYHDFASGRVKWAALGLRDDRGNLIES